MLSLWHRDLGNSADRRQSVARFVGWVSPPSTPAAKPAAGNRLRLRYGAVRSRLIGTRLQGAGLFAGCQPLPAESDLRRQFAHQPRGAGGDAASTHGFIEEEGIVAGMRPDQAGAQAARLESLKG